MKNITNRIENEMLNLLFTCSIHATEFSHWNNPVFTAQSAYCKSANRSTFFNSYFLDSLFSFCTKVHSVILKKMTEWISVLHFIHRLDLLFKKLHSLYKPKNYCLTLKKNQQNKQWKPESENYKLQW